MKCRVLSKHLLQRMQQNGRCTKPLDNDEIVWKLMSFSYDMKWKTFIKASSINDIHTGENLFAVAAFKGLLDVFFLT